MRKHRNPRPKVSKQPPADNSHPGEPQRLTKGALVALEEALDELGHLIARTAAAVFAVDDLHEKIIMDDRTDERDEDRRAEHLRCLIGSTKEAAMAAVEAGEEIASEVFRLRTARRRARP